MPRKTLKAKAEEVLTELKEEGVIAGFTPVEVNCTHQNLAEENGVTFCQVCKQTI